MLLDSPARPIPAASASTSSPATSSCTVPDSEPRLEKLVPPVYSEAMRERNKAGVVDISIDLRPDGGIAKAVVLHSSGDDLLDAASFDAARASTYTPAVRTCVYLAGTYIFRTRFRSAPSGGAHPGPDVPGPFASQAPTPTSDATPAATASSGTH